MSFLHTLFLENEGEISETKCGAMFFKNKSKTTCKKLAKSEQNINIGTQCVQELFFGVVKNGVMDHEKIGLETIDQCPLY